MALTKIIKEKPNKENQIKIIILIVAIIIMTICSFSLLSAETPSIFIKIINASKFQNNLNWINNTSAVGSYLAIDGSNANQNIDIGIYNLSIGDSLRFDEEGEINFSTGNVFRFNHGIYIDGANGFLDVDTKLLVDEYTLIGGELNVSNNINIIGNYILKWFNNAEDTAYGYIRANSDAFRFSAINQPMEFYYGTLGSKLGARMNETTGEWNFTNNTYFEGNLDLGGNNITNVYRINATDWSNVSDAISLWQRTGTILSPKTSGDDITTTGTGSFKDLIINPYNSYTNYGNFWQGAKVNADTITTIYTMTKARGGGVGGVGLGLRWLMQLENGAGVLHDATNMEASWTNNTAGSEDIKWDFNVMSGGSYATPLSLQGANVQIGDSTSSYHGINTAPHSDYGLKLAFAKSTPANTKGYLADIDATMNIGSREGTLNYGFETDLDSSGTIGGSESNKRNIGIYNKLDSSDVVNADGNLYVTGSQSALGFSGTINSGGLARFYGYYTLTSVNLGTAGDTEKHGGFFAVSGTADRNVGVWGAASGGTENWAFYSGAGDNFLGGDNEKTYFGSGKDSIQYWDGSNHILNTTAGSFIVYNNSGYGEGIANEWNVATPSLDNYQGNYLDLIKSPIEMLEVSGKLKRETMADVEKSVKQVRDENNCWEVLDKLTNETFIECETKDLNVTGVGGMAFANRLMISELKQKNEDLKKGICHKDFASWVSCLLEEI